MIQHYIVEHEEWTADVRLAENGKKCSITWTSDTMTQTGETELREPKVIIREGSYQPQQLGLYMEGVNWIHIGSCQLRPDLGINASFSSSVGHSHPEIGVICLVDGAYVFSDEGVVDDVLIHEYCHILRGFDSKEDSKENSAFTVLGGHDRKWMVLMEAYGLCPDPYLLYLYK